ncbi:MAG: AAA family ATPase, partial [Clostridiales bacterium]|nr:AAA family ATPase [Clostridiales bacterium]
MNTVHGDRSYIEISSSFFEDFVGRGALYVDKTKFMEHVLDKTSKVMLITRPRRMGKSLNLDTLRTFLDCTRDTRHLFKGLYIENSTVWGEVNKYPVIYLDFKNLTAGYYKEQAKNMLVTYCEDVFPTIVWSKQVNEFFDSEIFDTEILQYLSRDIYNHYGIKPYIIIDEYDSLFMNSIESPGFQDFREWLRNILSSALKGNRFLEKAVLTGVNRIAQESLFSGLNNLRVYDVFTKSKFDTDFGLTEEEVIELIPDTEERKKVKEWYNGFRVGGCELYNIYSVMSYLASRKFDNYWGMSGVMLQFKKMLTPSRQEKLGGILAGKPVLAEAEPRLIYDALLRTGNERTFWGLAVQTGYLSYDLADGHEDYIYYLRLPGIELKRVWIGFIINEVYCSANLTFRDALAKLPDFDGLGEVISGYLSYYDFDEKEPEKTYHVAVLFLLSAMGLKVTSNKESGLGRYDI